MPKMIKSALLRRAHPTPLLSAKPNTIPAKRVRIFHTKTTSNERFVVNIRAAPFALIRGLPRRSFSEGGFIRGSIPALAATQQRKAETGLRTCYFAK